MAARLEAGVQAIQIFDSWAGSHYERGYATFVVPAATLPATGGLVSRGGIPASRNAAAAHPCDHDRMPLRCLLVDENDAFLEAARVLLEREGLTVVGVASSTAEALRQAHALRPDVLLVLAQGDQGDGAPVILISARAETDYTELIAESPAVGFLPKPELSARGINRILGRTP